MAKTLALVTKLKNSNLGKKAKKTNFLRLITVIIPTAFSLIYFTLIASDVYISESSFVVRSSQNQQTLSGVGALLQGFGMARSNDDTYTVQEFMRSRNALTQLQEVLPMRAFYEDKGDLFSRFDPLGFNSEQEAFYQYFQTKESVSIDSVSGIATLRIRSFNAEDSQKINRELLKFGESLINRLNERASKDTIAFAEQAVKEAETRVTDTALALSNYRVENKIFDVKSQSEIQQNLISQLQAELISVQSQLAQIQAITPNNPQVRTLKTREASLKKEINNQIQLILGGADSSITNQAAEYQRLMLDNTLAQQQLTTAMSTLQNTRSEAERQQLYLEVIGEPSEPDLALEPYRLYNILATFFIGLMLYGILSLLLASVREHKN